MTDISRRVSYYSTYYLLQGRYFKLSGYRQILLLATLLHNFYQLTFVNFFYLIYSFLQKTLKINLHRIIFYPYYCSKQSGKQRDALLIAAL